MIEEIFDDQEIESAQENLPPSEKAFKFMSELNKFKGPTVNIDSPSKSFGFLLNDPFSFDSARQNDETCKSKNFIQRKSFVHSLGKSNISVNFFENCSPNIKTNTMFKEDMTKETANIGGFLKVYKQLFKITTKLREKLQFRNIDQANNKHLQIINDKAQSNNETEVNLTRSFKRFPTTLKEINFSRKFCNNLCLYGHKFLDHFGSLFMKYVPIINPGMKIKIIWDSIIFFVILFLFFMFPLELSFNYQENVNSSIFDGLSILQRNFEIVFSIFIGMDILLKFTTGFYRNGKLITNRKEIIKNYAKKGLIYDSIFFLQLILSTNLQYSSSLNGQKDLQGLIRVLRICIFFKIPEIIRFFHVLEEIFQLTNVGIAIFQLTKLTSSIFLFSHFMGCGWHAISYYVSSQNNMLKAINIYDAAWQTRYFRCLFITVNPGKVDPKNDSELIFGFFALLATSGSIGFMISGIHNIMRTLSKSNESKRKSIKRITDFMKKKNIDFDLQNKVREYINTVFDQGSNPLENETNLINKLNNSLKEELLFRANGDFLIKAPIFKYFETSTIKQLVLSMKKICFYPEDIIFQKDVQDSQSIYFIEDGEVSLIEDDFAKTKLADLSKGNYFGEMSFLINQRRSCSAVSLGFTSLYYITQQDFISILKDKPKEYEKYCFIKDEILFNLNYKFSGLKCYACGTRDHIIENCKKIHFTVDKAKISQKYSYYIPCKSRCFFQRKRNLKINSRFISQRVKFAQENFVTDNSDYLNKEEEEEYEQNESQIEESKSFKTCKTMIEKTDEGTDSSSKTDENKRSIYFSGSNNTNRTKTKDYDGPFRHQKKEEENKLDVLLRDFESMKDYQNYYPFFNIDAVLRKYFSESNKTKRSRKTHKLIAKNRKSLLTKQFLNTAKSRDV